MEGRGFECPRARASGGCELPDVETELGSSAKAASALSCRAISSVQTVLDWLSSCLGGL